MDKVVMTEEMRNKMAGLLPMREEAVHSFVPDSFKEFEGIEGVVVPTFRVKQWNNAERIAFSDKIKRDIENIGKQDQQYGVDTRKDIVTLVQRVIVGWENLVYFDNSDEVVFEGRETLDRLPDTILKDVLREVAVISGLAKRESEK